MPCQPVQAVILVAAPVPVVEVVEAILPAEVRVVPVLQRQPLRLGPVRVISPAHTATSAAIPEPSPLSRSLKPHSTQ